MKSVFALFATSLLVTSVTLAETIHCGESPWNYRVESVDFTENSAHISTDVAVATYYIEELLEQSLGRNVVSSSGLELEIPTKGTPCETALGVVINCQMPVAKARLLSKYYVHGVNGTNLDPQWEVLQLNEEVEIQNLDIQTGLRSGTRPGEKRSIVIKVGGLMNFRGTPIKVNMNTGLNCNK